MVPEVKQARVDDHLGGGKYLSGMFTTRKWQTPKLSANVAFKGQSVLRRVRYDNNVRSLTVHFESEI